MYVAAVLGSTHTMHLRIAIPCLIFLHFLYPYQQMASLTPGSDPHVIHPIKTSTFLQNHALPIYVHIKSD